MSRKLIIKNTAYLYIRMAVMMIISFFTAGITLNALGVSDYGINSVVGGLVSMFSLISNSLTSASARFITVGLGENNLDKLKKIFSMSINIHLILAVATVIAIESIGVWFLNNKMVIPPDRLYAANWVLQGSVVTFAAGLLLVPYNSLIIAHERMSVFAWMTIFDATGKLGIICAVYYYRGDRLILLSLMLLAQTVIRQLIYWIYCRRKFIEATYMRIWDKTLGKEMFSFAGWEFIGSTSGVMKDQGVNIVINLFAGPAVNAARGIAMQVNNMIAQFINNFTVALTPQIMKTYAAGELEKMHQLIYQGTRLSYYLFMLLSIPVFFETEQILFIWLRQVPPHTILFTRLVVVLSLLEIISYALINAQAATGKIRNYQIVVGGILLLNLPVSYIFLHKGFFPEITVVTAIVISQICLIARLCFLRHMIKLSARKFMKKVYLNVLAVTGVSLILPAVCWFYMEANLFRLFSLGVVSLISSVLSIYYIGCNRQERQILVNYASNAWERFKK